MERTTAHCSPSILRLEELKPRQLATAFVRLLCPYSEFTTWREIGNHASIKSALLDIHTDQSYLRVEERFVSRAGDSESIS